MALIIADVILHDTRGYNVKQYCSVAYAGDRDYAALLRDVILGQIELSLPQEIQNVTVIRGR